MWYACKIRLACVKACAYCVITHSVKSQSYSFSSHACVRACVRVRKHTCVRVCVRVHVIVLMVLVVVLVVYVHVCMALLFCRPNESAIRSSRDCKMPLTMTTALVVRFGHSRNISTEIWDFVCNVGTFLAVKMLFFAPSYLPPSFSSWCWGSGYWCPEYSETLQTLRPCVFVQYAVLFSGMLSGSLYIVWAEA